MAAPLIPKEAIDFMELQYDYGDEDEWMDDYEFDNKHIHAQCPQCKRNYNIVHSECGEYIDLCTCPSDSSEKIYHCFACNVTFTVDEDHGVEESQVQYSTKSLFDDDTDSYYGGYGGLGKVGYDSAGKITVTAGQPNAKAYKPVKKCSHKHDEIEIADGYFVYCSSVNYVIEEADNPDFGLYADYSWRPTWRNEFINWPDYNMPKDKEIALTQIVDAYERILNGEMVEIGCIGGHGRTGTILACLYLLGQEGSVTPNEAYHFVKNSYCVHAIESDIQEWFIEYASGYWYGTEVPEEPVYVPKTYGGTTGGKTTKACQVFDHYAMMIRGWPICSDKGTSCSFWVQDARTFKENPPKEVLEKANHLDILNKYDYMYGGLRLVTDAEDSPCKPIDHYAMILNGHDECLRLGDECKWWDSDFSEYINKSTINQITLKDWHDEADRVKFYLEFYPKAEDLIKKDDNDG